MGVGRARLVHVFETRAEAGLIKAPLTARGRLRAEGGYRGGLWGTGGKGWPVAAGSAVAVSYKGVAAAINSAALSRRSGR